METNSPLKDQMMLRPGIMNDARILVTGGGTGLGAIMAEGCASLGARVYICGRRGAILEETAAAINARLGADKVRGLPCDIRSAEGIAALLDTIEADGGPLTGLVNNAAANFIARAQDVSPRGYDAIADTVSRGTFLLTTECGRRWLKAGKGGSVVSILTTWVWNGGPFGSVAAMCKSAVHSMTQSLAVEWASKGIRLNAVCPGAFPTEGMSARLLTDDHAGGNNKVNPMNRNGHPAELANLVTYLLAPGSEFVTAQTIAIDGAGYQGNGANFAGLTEWTDADWQAAREKIRSTDAADKAARTTEAAVRR